MRIGINATCLNHRPSGARQRFIGLFSHLVPLMPESTFVFFEPLDCEVAAFLAGHANVERRRTPVGSEGRWQRAWRGMGYWSDALRAERFDVFEALHLPLIRPGRSRVILTIHDVRGLHAGLGVSSVMYRHVLRQALRGTDLVVTVSEAMKAEIQAFRPETRIAVIPNGLEFAEPVDEVLQEAVLRRLGLPSRFLLAVGHLEPRKNYPALLDAMRILKASGQGLPLVIVGNESGAGERIRGQIATNGLQSDVFMLSGLSDEDLAALYAASALFVFPSLYEGFGIPLLEAMQARTPVVASDLPVFREVLGEAGSWVDPHSPASIADGIIAVLGDPARQAEMRAAGTTRLASYRFGVLAERMRDHYLGLGDGRTD